jgi:hypothetical protein
MAGYSATPLIKKLGIKPGMSLCILNAPETYAETLGPLPDAITLSKTLRGELDFIHFFTRSKAAYEGKFDQLKTHLAKGGMLWISWPKKASKVVTDMTEDVVREYALSHGLVDVKVAAIDEVWSGLKLVYRLKDR